MAWGGVKKKSKTSRRGILKIYKKKRFQLVALLESDLPEGERTRKELRWSLFVQVKTPLLYRPRIREKARQWGFPQGPKKRRVRLFGKRAYCKERAPAREPGKKN